MLLVLWDDCFILYLGRRWRSFVTSVQKLTLTVTRHRRALARDLKKSLLNLTSIFDEVNLEVKDSLELHIYFDTFRHAPPPPEPEN